MILNVDANLYRGPRPDSMQELELIGVKTIISLEEGWFEFFHNKLGREAKQACVAGIGFIHIPLSSFCSPTQKQVGAIMSSISFNRSFGAVYVHCLHGVDRTGFICAAYRVLRQGWTVDDAVQEWKADGFHKNWYFTWERAFRTLMKVYG